MTRSRTVAVLLLLAALVAGGGIGYTLGEARHGHRHDGRRGPDGYLERLTRELDLDTAQQDSVRALLDRMKPRYDSLWAVQRVEVESLRALHRPAHETLRAAVRSAIRAQLRPDQQQRYDDYLARLDAKRRSRENRNEHK